MLQILLFEKTQASIIYFMVSGIFSFVARVYDVMLKLAGRGEEAGSITQFYLSDMATAIYTLAGVFMLFRVTIAAINMIINPDAVNDGKAGAGKILTRIITSLAMLILFVPNGWIFGDEGILNRIEKALLAEGGLINNLVPDPLNSVSEPENKESVLVDNISAASSQYDCYYVYISGGLTDAQQQKLTGGGSGKETATTKKSSVTISDVLHVTFYNNNSSGTNNLCVPQTGRNDCSKYKYSYSKTSPYAAPFGQNKEMTWNALENGWPESYNCPNKIKKTTLGSVASDGYVSGATDWHDVKNAGYYVGGWHSEANMRAAVSAKDATTNVVGNNSKKTGEIRNLLGLTTSAALLVGVSDDAIDFAQMAMGTFITCSEGAKCDDLKAGSLVSTGGDDAIVEAMAANPPTAYLDFLPAVVGGIGILVWLVVLCVDVIVRRFKLMLLQMIAPIPIISYSDPNDKMFSEWGKMYIATYLDLFLKLIAISFAISLLNMLWAIKGNINGLIELFFYIIAILVFAKMIPSMISKIFGIDNLGGSFKDIVGMGKKTLGFGAGAALGAATGIATGAGLGRLSGFAAGAFKGAKSGMKGDLTGGAKSVAARNYNLREAKANGLDFGDRIMGRAQAGLGIDPKKRIEDQIKGKEFLKGNVNAVQNAVTDVEKSLEGTNVMKDLKNAFDRGEIDANSYKSGMMQLARIWDNGGKQLKDDNGNDTGFYDTKIQIRKKNGDMYGGEDGLTVKAETGFHEGYKSAVSRLDKTVETIQSNTELTNTLTSEKYGLDFNPVDKTGKALKGIDKIQGIKGSTFGADSTLQEEIIELKNGPEMQRAQAIDSYNAGQK